MHACVVWAYGSAAIRAAWEGAKVRLQLTAEGVFPGGSRSCTIVNLVLIAAWLLFYESIDTYCARRAATSAAICYFNCAPVGHRCNSLPAAVNVCSAIIRHAHEATGKFVSGG